MRALHILITIFLLEITGCSTFYYDPPTPEPVAYSDEGLSPRLKTLVRTDHQGFHEVTAAKAYINKDHSISIVFEPALPAYWLGMDLKIMNGNFRARPYGTPFRQADFSEETRKPGAPDIDKNAPSPASVPNGKGKPDAPAGKPPRKNNPVHQEMAFEITKQELILQEIEIAPGHIISGCTSINFTQHIKNGESTPHFFTGCFSAALYPEGGYSLLSPENLTYIANQDFDLARHELGEPMHQARFARGKADSFQSEMLGSNVSNRTEVLESTWDTSLEAKLSDSGTRRLSVWYTRQGDQWFPVAHKLWTRGMDQVPTYLDKPGE